MGLDLNVTYYFGQVRPEFRGELALFLEIDRTKSKKEQKVNFQQIPLSEVTAYTEQGIHSPLRSYIGVNDQAREAIQRRIEQGNLESALDLDVVIIRREIIQRRDKEFSDLEYSTLQAAIATGK